MVRIEAIIRPDRLDAVREALGEINIQGMSMAEIKGVGKQKGYTEHFRGSEYHISLLPKVQLVIVVENERQYMVVDAIEEAARIGEIGDGKIFVSPIMDAIRIRTGDRGIAALS